MGRWPWINVLVTLETTRCVNFLSLITCQQFNSIFVSSLILSNYRTCGPPLSSCHDLLQYCPLDLLLTGTLCPPARSSTYVPTLKSCWYTVKAVAANHAHIVARLETNQEKRSVGNKQQQQQRQSLHYLVCG